MLAFAVIINSSHRRERHVFMQAVRFAIVGLGVMGRTHLKSLVAERDGITVTGAADVLPAARQFAESLNVPAFATVEQLLDTNPEVLLIATPHPLHEQAAVLAATRGINVLCEKPVAATLSAADRMVVACKQHHVLLGIDFQTRLSPVFHAVRNLIAQGEIGEISRVGTVATSWYRTQKYYDSGSWRGTWQGEGGGVLMNQAPHNLDLYCWLAGLPQRVKATVHTRIHRMETENTVAAILEHEGGRVDTFVTTTAEYPGQSEWTIAGDRGTIHTDGKTVKMFRLGEPLTHHIFRGEPFSRPEGAWEEVVIPEGKPGETGHTGMVRRFAQSVRTGEPVLANGEDGVRALELGASMILAGYRDKAVGLPVDRREYDGLLEELMAREV